MCGICILWGPSVDSATHQKSLDALKARGPDASTSEILTSSATTVAIGFTRLHIQGESPLEDPEQPFRLGSKLILCNGEIYNAPRLVKELSIRAPPTSSDCVVIPALLVNGSPLEEVCRLLDGDFAITVVDMSAETITVARDPYGVRPLFYATNGVWSGLASELKGFPSGATTVFAIEPGTVQTFPFVGAPKEAVVWHQAPWLKIPYWKTGFEQLMQGAIAMRLSLIEAVIKRLACTESRDIGACLSGGLDSSVVAAIAAAKLKETGKRLHTYSIGMEGSPDLKYARIVADHIGSDHHERIVTAEECLASIPEVIKAIESFDITTVRASVGNYLLGRLIVESTPNVKVVLNGDGADEVLGGYLYMRAAPSDPAFEAETDRLLHEIHRYDVLRSERSMAAHGLESRSPFLDRQFVSIARSLPTDRLRSSEKFMEKLILRSVLKNTTLLPDEIVMRRKEAFSDGISRTENSWFESAKAAGEAAFPEGWATQAASYTVNPPPTAEALWYRELFHRHYPAAAAVAAAPTMWMPRWVDATDPSARTLAFYGNKKEEVKEEVKEVVTT